MIDPLAPQPMTAAEVADLVERVRANESRARAPVRCGSPTTERAVMHGPTVDRYHPDHHDPTLQTPGSLPVPRYSVTFAESAHHFRSGRRRCHCSVCHQPGHSLRTCPERAP